MSLTMHLDRLTLRHKNPLADSEREVLSGIEETLSPGVTALMGANGTGKSSLMRLCALIEQPTSGKVSYTINGSELPLTLELKRRICMVLAKGGIFNSSVCANAAYGLRLRGIKGDALKHQAHEALERVGLMDKLKQNALTLSSGESQRLAIARALAVSPDVLLLDEPTASVDEANSHIIESIIEGLKQDARKIVLIATHDREQAQRLASRTLIIKDGKLQ